MKLMLSEWVIISKALSNYKADLCLAITGCPTDGDACEELKILEGIQDLFSEVGVTFDED